MKTIDDINFKGKRALIRVDFNVPLDKSFNVTDDNRIRAALLITLSAFSSSAPIT